MGLPNFHHHPQGNIYIRTNGGVYNDTLTNFNLDLASVGAKTYAGLSDLYQERYYEPNVKSYLIKGDYYQVGDPKFNDGDLYISLYEQLQTAKQARENQAIA